jgi:NADPH:quinone reductase
MKAAFIERPGPPESICYCEVETPVIRNARQVLVKFVAVTVNPIDTYIRSGAYPIALPRPFIIGRDMVGVVDSVETGVMRFTRGQKRVEQQPARHLCRIRQCGRRPASFAARRGE